MLHLGSRLPGCVSENCGCGGKFVLLPKNLENVAAFSKFLCPPHLLGSNFPPPFCHYFRTFTDRASFLVTFSPSRCGCALPRWELWSLLGRFAGIGRVILSREGENGAYA